ncbi:SPOR domain-containing protein [Massilia cavernae]|uniref:SPOR domain-containing protein n=1 Tax=Massilia cavernae TaxID=2320864 RepID=A0A418XSA7_9BURK|nr:SPOR domain-containing protein [Massilia cavernae]RJG15438.1 SPOR domain-containing protein [Massilia cavernae]
MLKFIFWFLLAINGVLFAYGRGYLGNFKGNEREPARMKAQVNTDKLTLVSAAQATVAAAPAEKAQESAPAAAEPAPVALLCTEIGNFNAQEARRFDGRIAALRLGQRPERENIASTEMTSFMVHIPPQASREAADRRAEELKNLGVSNYYVIPDNTPMKWAISLGVFKSENAAKTLLAALARQGVADARISGRPAQVNRVAYRFRGIDEATRARIERIAANFPEQQARVCK